MRVFDEGDIMKVGHACMRRTFFSRTFLARVGKHHAQSANSYGLKVVRGDVQKISWADDDDSQKNDTRIRGLLGKTEYVN